MSGAQLGVIEMLMAAMKDAVTTGHLTQMQLQFDPTENGKGPLKTVRIVVMPEKMDHTWPSYAPFGTNQG